MAKGKKTGGRDFSGEPGPGRPKITPEVKALRQLTTELLKEIGELILLGDKPALTAIANSQTEPAVRVIYARAACNAMTKGDVTSLELILNRVVGKVKEKTDVNVEGLIMKVYDYSSKKEEK